LLLVLLLSARRIASLRGHRPPALSGRTYAHLAGLVRALCAVAGRCWLPLVTAGMSYGLPTPGAPSPACGRCSPVGWETIPAWAIP